MEALVKKARGSGRIYLTGGASALMIGWRQSTIHVVFFVKKVEILMGAIIP
jgi:hypothetical protein